MLSAILCSVDNIELSTLKSLATEHDIYIQPRPINIPKHAPLNKQQYQEWNTVWPINYREDPRQDPKWTQQHIDTIIENMKQLMMINNSNKKGDDDQLLVYARIVDPTSNTILAEAVDTRHQGHPLHHAVMNCIDQIAEKELNRKSLENNKKRKFIDEQERLDYLCSGYDIYITHEPCAM